ncbi:ABC transporter permease [Oceanicaulis alexandrii]|uniref:ABC transporter permease n=1 Tax=Oceanicaulis alexandrii TaxID=153233 RepID=UPI0023526851|nr:FtsX-like permease family protein [Oceanicaulis alexandrii]
MTRRWLSVLDLKLWRDVWSMRGQALAIALVIAGGVSVHLVMAGMLGSLDETRSAYYERYRFADIWAPAVRAPNAVLDDIRRIDGVAAAQSRILSPVLFDIPDMAEPPSGVIYSLPHAGRPLVNDIHLVSGSMPDPARRDQVVVLEGFATAHGLTVGDTVTVTIRGGRERLSISGIALSPEYVYAIAPGQIVPDPLLFGVLWMDREALETAADQQGAFNEVVVRLSRGADPAPVRAAIDRILEPYGGAGAYTRREHVSAAFLQSELDQLQTMGAILPPIFLAVAAFLVNIVISRLIAVEREQIGLLKAFGYSSEAVSLHYLKLVGVIAALGLVIGFALGTWLGHAMAMMYVQYYSFPFLIFSASPSVYAIGVLVTVVAVGGGAVWSVLKAARLEPAVAMRPPPPPDYSRGAGVMLTRLSLLDHQSRMVLRQIFRWPVRAGLTVTGIAASGALLVMTLYFLDAMEVMIENYFDLSNRHDMAVSFTEPRTMAAFHDLAGREGVLEAEPFRIASARLRYDNREVLMGITGVIDDPALSRMMDSQGRTVSPPPGGLILSQDLANRLHVQSGELLTAQITEGSRPRLERLVVQTPDVLIGSGAQMRLEDLNAALGEGRVISGVYLRVDPAFADALYLALKDAPLVAGVQLHTIARENFTELMDRSIGRSIFIYTLFAGMIALGVIYNSVRVSLAERERELASLRVLGFTKGAVSYILLAESAILTLVALPISLVAGAALAWGMAKAMSSDFFRLPFVIEPSTYGYTTCVLIVIALISGLIVRQRINRLDLIAVLKTRE